MYPMCHPSLSIPKPISKEFEQAEDPKKNDLITLMFFSANKKDTSNMDIN